MQKTHCGRESPTIIFGVSQVSKIPGLLLFCFGLPQQLTQV
jgi:hypothetical protein